MNEQLGESCGISFEAKCDSDFTMVNSDISVPASSSILCMAQLEQTKEGRR
jgi:hypothetical protein